MFEVKTHCYKVKIKEKIRKLDEYHIENPENEIFPRKSFAFLLPEDIRKFPFLQRLVAEKLWKDLWNSAK